VVLAILIFSGGLAILFFIAYIAGGLMGTYRCNINLLFWQIVSDAFLRGRKSGECAQ
jgi:hypothetical protein